MRIIVHGTEKEGIGLTTKAADTLSVTYVSSIEGFLQHAEADVYLDLRFENNNKRIALLNGLKGLVVINSVVYTLEETSKSFIRINGWPGFLESDVIEAAYLQPDLKDQAETLFGRLHKTVEWLPDEPGFITPRVIGMIINEAYYALEEEVSTKEDIDTAMKLGTAYPYGPFEWAEKIGLKNILQLLEHLSKEKIEYAPAPLLLREALISKD